MPTLSLANRVAIVTGASRGIGAAVATTLAAHGASVVVHYRERVGAANDVVSAIKRAGGQAIPVSADLRNGSAIEALFQRAHEAYGKLDILVNNAGIGTPRHLVEVDDAHLLDVMNVNFNAVVIACREAVRRFGDRGGRIVSISSLNARIAAPGASIYAASKAAVESLTRSLASELGARKVTVNAVAPGFTDTDMLASIIPRDQWAKLATLSAAGRVGQPSDIADVVRFLASDDARWITGQVISADGGVRAW